MADVRRIIIIFVIATLFSVLVFTTIDAFYPSPNYEDYCGNEYRMIEPQPVMKQRPSNFSCPETNFDESAMQQCLDDGGDINYENDDYGCHESWECSYCNKNYQDAREKHNFWRFIISAILGLVGIAIGLYLPTEKNSVHEWVGSGLMLGGVVTIFIGTAMFFGDLHRWVRPIIILFELILVIYLSYTKLAPKK